VRVLRVRDGDDLGRGVVSKPRAFDITNEADRDRLLRETLGYARVSLHERDGTDLTGRMWAHSALKMALDLDYKLVPPTEKIS